MAHVIDFTLFCGGVASAPAAELPFAGSSFDVQRGTARRAVFGVPEVESVAIAELGAVTGAAPVLGVASVLNAVTLDVGSAGERVAAFGTCAVSTGVELGGLTAGAHEAGLGLPDAHASCAVDLSAVPERAPAIGELAALQAVTVTFDGVPREAAFGAYSLATKVEVGTASLVRDAELGTATVLNALALDVASVPDVPTEAGKPVVTTASFVELDGFGRTAVLGKPSITIEAFPASVVRQPAVGAAAFVSAKETTPASVPDTAALVSGADFVSVTLVRPAGMAAGSAEMGGAVTVETTALMLPAGIGRQEAFGRPSLAVMVRPNSLIHDSVIGGADLIPAHTADMAAFVQAAAFGVPDVGFCLLVEPESVEPRGHTFGTPAYGWRKCPRWDFRAQVRREAELGAEIRPAPVATQVWRGEGCVRRERTMAAVVARWADLHTVARRRNAMDAAVRRKEQI